MLLYALLFMFGQVFPPSSLLKSVFEGGREGVKPQQCHVGGDHIKLNIIRAHLDYDEEAYRLGVFRECSNTIGYKNGFFFAQVFHYIQDVSGGQLQS